MANTKDTRVIEIVANGSRASNTIKELSAATRQLRAELRTLDPTSQEFVNGTKKLNDVNRRLAEVQGQLKNTQTAWERMKTQAKGVMIGALGAGAIMAGVSAIGNFFRTAVTGAGKLEDQLADVRKTTGLTDEEVRKLNSDLKEIDTRTSREELLALSRDAGKLGIEGRENILQFVRAADKIKVALGEDLGEDAINQIGKLVTVFDLEKAFGFEKGMLKIGSAVNTVGSKSAATEGFLVDFMARLGGVARTADLSAPSIIGYGATLDSLGMKVELSSTALQTFFIDFVRESDKFGAAVGMTKGALQKLMDEKGTNAAFIEWLRLLKSGSKESQDMLNKLDELGIDGARGASVMLTLANNIGIVEEQQKIANKAFEEGTSVQAEFNVKNNTLAANMEKNMRKIQSALQPLRSWIGRTFGDFVGWLVKSGSELLMFGKFFILGIASWAGYRLAVALTATSLKNFNLVQALTTRLFTLQAGAHTFGIGLWALMTGNITKASAAMKTFNLVTKLNPIGFLVGLITAVVVAWKAFGSAVNETDKVMKESRAEATKSKIELERLNVIAQSNVLTTEQRAGAIKKIKELMPGYLNHLTDEQIRTGAATAAIREYIEALENKTRAQGFAKLAEEKAEKLAEGEVKIAAAEEKRVVMMDNLNKKIALGKKVKYQDREDVNYYTRIINNQQKINDELNVEIKRITTLQTKYETLGNRPPNVFEEQGKGPLRKDSVPSGFGSAQPTSDSSDLLGIQKQVRNDAKRVGDAAPVVSRTSTTTTEMEMRKKTIIELTELVKSENDQIKEAAKTEIDRREKVIKVLNEYKETKSGLIEDLKRVQVDSIVAEETREIASLKLKEQEREKSILKEIEIEGLSAEKKKELRTTADSLILAEREKLAKDISILEEKYAKERAEKEFDLSEKNLNNWYAQERLIISDRFARGEMSEKEYLDGLKVIDRQFLGSKKNIYEDYGKDVTAINQQIADDQIILNEKELGYFRDVQVQKSNAAIAAAESRIRRAKDGTREYLDAEIGLLNAQFSIEYADLQKRLDMKLLKEEEYIAAKKKLDTKYEAEKTELTEKSETERARMRKRYLLMIADESAQLTQNIISLQYSKEEKRINREMKLSDKKYSNEKKKLDEQLSKKIITEEQYNFAKTALDEKQEDEIRASKRKMWEINQSQALIEAEINGMVAVTKALASSPPPYNIILAGITAAAVAVQVAKINQQEPPEFRRGTVLNGRGTVLQGPSHEGGGIDLFGEGFISQVSGFGTSTPLRDQNAQGTPYYGNAEGGEIILTKGVFENPEGRRMASDLNESFGGIRFDGGQKFQVLSPKFQVSSIAEMRNPRRFDLGGVARAYEVTRTASTPLNGRGVKSTSTSPVVGDASFGASAPLSNRNDGNQALIGELQRNNALMLELIDLVGDIPTVLTAAVDYGQLEKTVLTLREARRRGKLNELKDHLLAASPEKGMKYILADRRKGI